MNQRTKNIRLIIVWLVLLLVTIAAFVFDEQGDQISVPRDVFAVEDVSTIDEVVFSSSGFSNRLIFTNGQWVVNDTYKADPQRVTVLFAILKQNKVRRKVSASKKSEVDSIMKGQGIEIKFLESGSVTKQFNVVGKDGLTYFSDDRDTYIMEIPGYRVDLAGIFQLDEGGWRNPLVFDINWANLQEVNMLFPGRERDQFDVVYKRRYYTIKQLPDVDSTKLTNFLDDVSLLFVNDYLDDDELKAYKDLTREPMATIIVKDVGSNYHTLTIYQEIEGEDQIIGSIDSTDYGVFDFEMIRKILRPKRYFEPK